MKVVLTSALFLFSSAPTWVGAFAPVGVIPTRTPQTFVAVQPLGATTTTAVNDATEQSSDFGTAMPTPNEEDPYAAFGLASPDELALGVEIKDLLKWIGTKDNLVRRVQQDVSSLTPAQVDDAVKLLLLDAEVLQRLVFYEQNKEEIAALVEDQSGDRLRTAGTYATWLSVGAGIPYIKRRFIDPKFESGEWDTIHISEYLPFLPKGAAADGIVDAVVSSPAADAVDSVSSTIVDSASEILSNAM